jgi:hypothetical protein
MCFKELEEREDGWPQIKQKMKEIHRHTVSLILTWKSWPARLV